MSLDIIIGDLPEDLLGDVLTEMKSNPYGIAILNKLGDHYVPDWDDFFYDALDYDRKAWHNRDFSEWKENIVKKRYFSKHGKVHLKIIRDKIKCYSHFEFGMIQVHLAKLLFMFRYKDIDIFTNQRYMIQLDNLLGQLYNLHPILKIMPAEDSNLTKLYNDTFHVLRDQTTKFFLNYGNHASDESRDEFYVNFENLCGVLVSHHIPSSTLCPFYWLNSTASAIDSTTDLDSETKTSILRDLETEFNSIISIADQKVVDLSNFVRTLEPSRPVDHHEVRAVLGNVEEGFEEL